MEIGKHQCVRDTYKCSFIGAGTYRKAEWNTLVYDEDYVHWLEERYYKSLMHKATLQEENDRLRERLIEAGLEKPAIKIDSSHG